MEWTIRWWQVSIKRVYPTSAQLSQTYNRSAPWWHQHLHFFGYDQAYIELWRSLQSDGVLSHLKDNSTLCDCGIGTAAFSLAFIKASHLNAHITGVDISSQMLTLGASAWCGSSKAQIALPQIKTGLIRLLTTGESVSGGIGMNGWGISIGILTLMGIGLAIRSLLRLRHWKQARHGIPVWRSVLSLSGMFFPTVLLLALPWLLALLSDRVFSYAMRYRAMPDVMIWLSVCALLGVINGTLRLRMHRSKQWRKKHWSSKP